MNSPCVRIFPKGRESTPSSRQRAYVVAQKLLEYGVHVEVAPFSNEDLSLVPWPKKLSLLLVAANALFKAKRNDIIYLQRTVYNKYFFLMVVLNKLIFRQKIIFDFDDAIFLHSPFKTWTLTSLADAVTVGSHFLFDWANKYNKNVILIPTSVEIELFEHTSPSYDRTNEFIIGFIGNGPVYFSALQMLSRVLKHVAKEKHIEFILIGTLGNKEIEKYFKQITEFKTKLVDRVPYHQIPQIIESFDIGVMPFFENTDWNKGKCAMKALEYMSAGVATVASNIGENTYVIQDGVNGMLANTENEWVEKIKSLLESRELRKNVGVLGRKTVAEGYSFDIVIPKLIKVINNVSTND